MIQTEDQQSIEVWRLQVLNLGSLALAVLSTLGIVVTALNPDIWRIPSTTALAIGVVGTVWITALWRSGPFYLRVGTLIVILLISAVTFLSVVGFTAAPAMACIVPVLLAGLLIGVRWAVVTWFATIALLIGGWLGIRAEIIPSSFDPAFLNPQDPTFGFRYTVTYATFSAVVAVGVSVLVHRLRRSLSTSRQALDARDASEAQWASLVENAPDLILLVDRDHKLSFRNWPLLGFAHNEVIGRPIEDFATPEQRQQVSEIIEAVFTTGQSFQQELHTHRMDGEPVILSTRFSPIMRGDEVRRVTLIATDISHQRDLEHQLQQAQKLEAIGRLAAGVAHDFNNLLMIVRGHAELLPIKAANGESLDQDVQTIIKSVERGATLTAQLLAYSRKNPHNIEQVNVRAVTESMVDMMQRLVGPNYPLEVIFDVEQAWVSCDQILYEQVLTNIIVNARDAMEHGGAITVRMRSQDIETQVDLSAGAYIEITIADKGSGIDAKTQRMVFEPFFTTKEIGAGTGLGLSMAYGAVKDWGGDISLESVPGQGTKVTVLLPQTDPPQASVKDNSSLLPPIT